MSRAGVGTTDLQAWREYFQESEDAYSYAIGQQAGAWLAEPRISERYLEVVERTRVARMRWEARLTAYNAFCEARAGEGAQIEMLA